MVSGSTKRRKKKRDGGKAQQLEDTTTEQQGEAEEVVLDAEGQEALALAQALGDGLQQQANGDDGTVTAALARRLAPCGIALTFDPDKGRLCVAVAGFEPGRVLLQERAYVHGSGVCTCLELLRWRRGAIRF